MAQIFKHPTDTNKGIIVFTHKEWPWLFQNALNIVKDLKQYFFLGWNQGIYFGNIGQMSPIVDFTFASPSVLDYQDNGNTLKIELMDRNFALGKIYKNPEICESNDPLPYKIVFYSINCEKPDREKLIYDLGSSQIAKNIVSYWGSQCFSDVLFIKINDRFVWFDIDR